ncbi:hypothetical protein Droror1_Dr00006390, partial [Drosera rotundifolia]
MWTLGGAELAHAAAKMIELYYQYDELKMVEVREYRQQEDGNSSAINTQLPSLFLLFPHANPLLLPLFPSIAVFGAWFRVSCSHGGCVVAAVFGVGLPVISRGFLGQVRVVCLCVAAGICFVGGGGGSVAVLWMREFVQGVGLFVVFGSWRIGSCRAAKFSFPFPFTSLSQPLALPPYLFTISQQKTLLSPSITATVIVDFERHR